MLAEQDEVKLGRFDFKIDLRMYITSSLQQNRGSFRLKIIPSERCHALHDKLHSKGSLAFYIKQQAYLCISTPMIHLPSGYFLFLNTLIFLKNQIFYFQRRIIMNIRITGKLETIFKFLEPLLHIFLSLQVYMHPRKFSPLKLKTPH